jgi:uncharacterized protein (DUF58 family)
MEFPFVAYDPADLRLPHWLLRLLDAAIRLRLPLAHGWRVGVTRPGVLLIAATFGVWGAAFYSANNLLYLCAAMLTALAAAAFWQGMGILRDVPVMADALPAWAEAGAPVVVHRPLSAAARMPALVELQWQGAHAVQMQWRSDGQASQLEGRWLAPGRGLYRFEAQKLGTAAPLGIWQFEQQRRDAASLMVMPKPVPWADSRGQSSDAMRWQEGDEWHDLRSYVPGDALARVHWRKAASNMNDWTVKRFMQPEDEIGQHHLRIDLRLPEGKGESAFERLLGMAWYWLESRMKSGDRHSQLTIGQQQFDCSSEGGCLAAMRAIAAAEPESARPAGNGGILLSLVEG